jgi:hypothetical protein
MQLSADSGNRYCDNGLIKGGYAKGKLQGIVSQVVLAED